MGCVYTEKKCCMKIKKKIVSSIEHCLKIIGFKNCVVPRTFILLKIFLNRLCRGFRAVLF